MATTIKQIAEALKTSQQIPPRVLVEWKGVLAGEYSFSAGVLEEILKNRPREWKNLREKTKSDKAADREWEGMESGINEMGLRLRMKSIEKLMSALSSLLKVAEGEAKNQW